MGLPTWNFFDLLYDNLVAVVVTVVLVFIGVGASFLHYQHRKYDHLPGPKRDSFWLGNVPTIVRYRKQGMMLLEIFLKWSLEYGHTYVIFFSYKPVVFTCDPAAIKELLVTGGHPKAKKTYSLAAYLYGARYFGDSLAIEADHSSWRKRRTHFDPAFHRTFLKSLVPEFNVCVDALLDKLCCAADEGSLVPMAPLLRTLTLDIIAKVGFGKDLDAVNDPSVRFVEAMNKAAEGLALKTQDPLGRFKFYAERQLKAEVVAALKYLRAVGRQWLQERRQAIEEGQPVPKDILTLLASAAGDGSVETEEVLIDDLLGFFIAGQDTTGSSLSFAVRELTRRPDTVKRLREEIDTVVGTRRVVSYEDLGQLTYTSMVVKETLRLYPPAPFTFREVMQGQEVAGCWLPDHTTVYICPFVSGRHPDFHPRAEEFIPERFAEGSPDRPSIYSYIPFSLGPRNCIGQHFAQIEIKLFLAKLVQRFDVKLHPSQSYDVRQVTTVKPTDSVLCSVTHRTDSVM